MHAVYTGSPIPFFARASYVVVQQGLQVNHHCCSAHHLLTFDSKHPCNPKHLIYHRAVLDELVRLGHHFRAITAFIDAERAAVAAHTAAAAAVARDGGGAGARAGSMYRRALAVGLTGEVWLQVVRCMYSVTTAGACRCILRCSTLPASPTGQQLRPGTSNPVDNCVRATVLIVCEPQRR